MNVKRSGRGLGVHGHASAVVEDAAAKRAQVLEKDGHEPFVAGTLPDETQTASQVACAPAASRTRSSRSRGGPGTRSVRQYSMPTSTNQGSA